MAGLGAGVSAPWGFSPYMSNNGPVNYATIERKISSSYATAIFYGDAVVPVTSTATGYISQATAGSVALAGIFLGCRYYSTSQKKWIWNNYWPGSDATGDVTAFVCNDPTAEFLVQAGATNLGFSVIGQNAQLAVSSGNTTTGISGMYLSTTGTTSTYPFIIVAVPGTESPASQTVPDPTQPYNQVVVAFQFEQFLTGKTGIS